MTGAPLRTLALAAALAATACGGPDAPSPAPAATAVPAVPPPAATATPPAAPAADAALDGIWMGVAGGASPVDVILVLERKDGALVALGALPAFGSLGDPVPDFAVRDGRLTGTLGSMVGSMKLDVAPAGEALEGTLDATPPGGTDPIRMPLRLERTVEARKADGARAWAGQLDIGAQQLMIGLVVAPGPVGRWAASVEIPAQGLGGLPCHVQRTDEGALTVRIPVSGNAILRLAPEGDRLRGTFEQGTFRTDIEFGPHALGTPLPAAVRKARPQDPKPPFPYAERTVQFMVPAGHVIEGTLTVPTSASAANRVPGVVLVTGSGPQDRDESLMGHRPFAVLADALARRGIAVLRCDDRGFGKSTGDFATATTDDFASDAAFAFLTLASKPEVDPSRIGILGHSEGAVAAALAVGLLDADQQSIAQAAFLVTLAGTGVDGDAVLREQNVRLMKADGRSDEDIAAARAVHVAFLDAVRQGADDATLRAKARDMLSVQMRVAGIDLAKVPPESIDRQAGATVEQMKSPWMRRFLALDPAEALGKVTCPVLVLNGDLDSQVTPAQNIPPIEAALRRAGVPATVRVLPGLNHLFQPAKTGALAEYQQIETTMDPSVPGLVADWIAAQPSRAPRPVAAPPAPSGPVGPVTPVGPVSPIGPLAPDGSLPAAAPPAPGARPAPAAPDSR